MTRRAIVGALAGLALSVGTLGMVRADSGPVVHTYPRMCAICELPTVTVAMQQSSLDAGLVVINDSGADVWVYVETTEGRDAVRDTELDPIPCELAPVCRVNGNVLDVPLAAGTYYVELEVDGQLRIEEEVTVRAGVSTVVTFSFQ